MPAIFFPALFFPAPTYARDFLSCAFLSRDLRFPRKANRDFETRDYETRDLGWSRFVSQELILCPYSPPPREYAPISVLFPHLLSALSP